MRIPVLPHHTLVFGRVLHNVIHFYLRKRMTGEKIAERELFEEYERSWINEGFLSREHEELRKEAGKRALALFYSQEEASDYVPSLLEKRFKWQEDKVKFIGRWDRVDYQPEGVVIIDFKASEVKDQKEADRRAKESLQMDLYALSFLKTQDALPLEIQLYFLESNIIGRAHKGEKELEKAREKIREVESGIRKFDFQAEPDWHSCMNCEFKTICPSSYAY